MPKDGQYEAQVYTGLGLMTTEAFVAAFSEHAENVKAAQAAYFLCPPILTANASRLQLGEQPRTVLCQVRLPSAREGPR